jgi:hypothetical protein
MEDFKNTSIPLLKKIDLAIFEYIDKFKLTPSYNNIQDFYNGLDEEQQKFFKAFVLLMIFFIPSLILGLVIWQNNKLKKDLITRIGIVSNANEIIAQKKNLTTVSPSILSENPIEGNEMMLNRISNILSTSGMDLSKIQINDYSDEIISKRIMKSEANFKFINVSTDELINIFTSMTQREKFKIQNVEITRDATTNLLNGEFHAFHLAINQNIEDE